MDLPIMCTPLMDLTRSPAAILPLRCTAVPAAHPEYSQPPSVLARSTLRTLSNHVDKRVLGGRPSVCSLHTRETKLLAAATAAHTRSGG